MTVFVNPKQIFIGDPAVATEGDTAFVLKVGTVSGGPYTASSATVQISSMTLSGTQYEVNMSAVAWSPALSPFTTYFMVAEAENAQGVSGNSPEVSFQIATAPAAPVSLTLA